MPESLLARASGRHKDEGDQGKMFPPGYRVSCAGTEPPAMAASGFQTHGPAKKTAIHSPGDEAMYGKFLTALLLMALSACGTPPLQGTVTKSHALGSASQSFALLLSPEQRESPEFQRYAGLVRSELSARGWREAPLDTADIAVSLQYQVSQGRQVAVKYPVYGQVQAGTITTFGDNWPLDSTATRHATRGVVGAVTGSRTEFDQAARLVMYSMPAYRSTQKMEPVYKSEIRSSAATGDLPTVMPALVRGLLEDFPGVSGSTRRVDVRFD